MLVIIVHEAPAQFYDPHHVSQFTNREVKALLFFEPYSPNAFPGPVTSEIWPF